MTSTLRPIAPSEVITAPNRVSTVTRLKGLSVQDEVVLAAFMGHVARERAFALRERVKCGTEWDKTARADLKRTLTARGSSSRLSGAIVSDVMGLWSTARVSQRRRIHGWGNAVRAIEERAAIPADQPRSYSPFTRHRKLGRRDLLRAKLTREQVRFEAGHVPITLGGKRTLNSRQHMADAEVADWRRSWDRARGSIVIPGEGGKRFGNDTLRVDPDSGFVEIQLPKGLCGLANRPYNRYQFSTPVSFARHQDAWTARATLGLSIAYELRWHPDRDRWYLTASFQTEPVDPVDLEVANSGRVVGVDLNATHVDAWCSDSHGNPLGSPRRFPMNLSGLPEPTRDARVREVISQVIGYAREMNAGAIAIEQLGWGQDLADSRERLGKQFRTTLHNFPTWKFAARARSMINRANLHLIAVDPAYTSKWGQRYWSRQLRRDRHELAALMISRRAQGHALVRRDRTRARDQRITTTSDTRTTNQNRVACERVTTDHDVDHGPPDREPTRETMLTQGTQNRSAPQTRYLTAREK